MERCVVFSSSRSAIRDVYRNRLLLEVVQLLERRYEGVAEQGPILNGREAGLERIR